MEEKSKAYNPQDIENKWYSFWETKEYFQANVHSKKPAFTIIMPPPNVTGVLHMGHALVNTLQDILIRWKRMCGFEVLWVPGTDHAGIATQTTVERYLIQTQGKNRNDFTREEFLQHLWTWTEKSKTTILNQIKALGCSCDWSRLAFTMDPPRSAAVRYLFKKMFDDGLIYRGNYLVNWDPVTQTALADDEVEYEDKESYLYYIRYPVVDSEEHMIVATVRPETILGDTAVAVSPLDLRYQHLIGKCVQVPLTNRIVPIIADTIVDPQFGTGAVKITPAHDPNDYEVAQRHNLPFINLLTPDGKINKNGGDFCYLTIDDARNAVIERLAALGLLSKKLPYTHRVGVSYRSKAVIEPYLSTQWFVKTSGFKDQLLHLVRNKEIRLLPPSFHNTYFPWIQNLKDWCISRQLVWGHRIPVWYHRNDPNRLICYGEDGIPPQVQEHPEEWTQDPDVLDTWFSSALWPLSVLGWPQPSPDFQKFYPTSVLITGYDILFFWVARMILVADYLTHKPPFYDVFLHGLIFGKSYWEVQDQTIHYLSSKERHQYDLGHPLPSHILSKWEKMSKSKGNIIDPLEIIETYGTDAMRLALAASGPSSRQIDLDRRRFEEFKNFVNKIWNGARFVLIHLNHLEITNGISYDLFSLEDRWILSRLNRLIEEVNAFLTEYAFDKATNALYNFFWKEFCCFYVEILKPTLFGKNGSEIQRENKQKILLVVLSNVLRLIHPIAPFISEELFQELKKKFQNTPEVQELYLNETLQALKVEACIIASYPKPIRMTDMDSDIEEKFDLICQIIHLIRNIRGEMSISPGMATSLYIVGPLEQTKWIQDHQHILQALIRLEKITFYETQEPQSFTSVAMFNEIKLIVPLPKELQEKEKQRLSKEKDKLLKQKQLIEEKLENEDFLRKAPVHLVEKFQHQLKETGHLLTEIHEKLQH